MKPITDRPEAHLYVCTNERPEGKSCCKKVGGHEFFAKTKDKLIQEGIRSQFWITRTGCLGFCNDVGCVVALYRDGEAAPEIYSEVEADDFDKVWKSLTGQ
ncbi:MAG: (2Fe-2S) ferredoxin domain-containing protein [Deltaproteobacteria bacterium]|nr:(2Fe-2S) ferredoxin domain-containing protein [Deltaproteobacteria bacterium]